MTIEQATVFLSASVLFVLGCLVILLGVIVANNMIARYWKPLGWRIMPAWYDEPPKQFMTQEEHDRLNGIDKSREPNLKK